MARRHEAEGYLKAGMYPTQIAKKMGVKINTVIPYLWIRLGEGGLTFWEICFSLPAQRHAKYDEIIDRSNRDYSRRKRACREAQLDVDECDLYQICRDAVIGDMYLNLAKLEIDLHQFVRRILESEYRQHDDEWWKKGIPLAIRQSCQNRREEDDQRLDPYAYTNLIHLKEIIDKKWNLFKNSLPTKTAGDKSLLLKNFSRINDIRNSVMHPIKMYQPTKDDFDFVQGFSSSLLNNQS